MFKVTYNLVTIYTYVKVNVYPYLLKVLEVHWNVSKVTLVNADKRILWSLTNHQRPVWQHAQVSYYLQSYI